MSFLRVDKDRLARKGSIFVARIDGYKIVVGRCQCNCKTESIMAIAADWITDGKLPAMEIIKFKRVKDTYKSEAVLNSYLMDFLDPSERFYEVDNKILDEYWKEV